MFKRRKYSSLFSSRINLNQKLDPVNNFKNLKIREKLSEISPIKQQFCNNAFKNRIQQFMKKNHIEHPKKDAFIQTVKCDKITGWELSQATK